MVDVHPLLLPKLHKTNKRKMFTDTFHPPGLSSNNCTIKNREKSKGQVCQPCGIFPKRIEAFIYLFILQKY